MYLALVEILKKRRFSKVPTQVVKVHRVTRFFYTIGSSYLILVESATVN